MNRPDGGDRSSPMAGAATAKEIIDAFAGDDCVKAAQQAVRSLVLISQFGAFKLAPRYEAA